MTEKRSEPRHKPASLRESVEELRDWAGPETERVAEPIRGDFIDYPRRARGATVVIQPASNPHPQQEESMSERDRQRLVLELTRERQKWIAEIERAEDGRGFAPYERGIAYGLNFALNRLTALEPASHE